MCETAPSRTQLLVSWVAAVEDADWLGGELGRMSKNTMTHIDHSPSNFPQITASLFLLLAGLVMSWPECATRSAASPIIKTRGSCNGILHKNVAVYVHEMSKNCKSDLGSLVRSHYCESRVMQQTLCTTPGCLMKIVSFTRRINNFTFSPRKTYNRMQCEYIKAIFSQSPIAAGLLCMNYSKIWSYAR